MRKFEGGNLEVSATNDRQAYASNSPELRQIKIALRRALRQRAFQGGAIEDKDLEVDT